MKLAESTSSSLPPSIRRIIISRINLSIKFPCRLYLQYSRQGQLIRSHQIKIEAKTRSYLLEEELRWHCEDEKPNQGAFLVYIKLVSSKGVPFTAGTLSISPKDIPKHSSPFNLKLLKPIDPDSYCECRSVSSSIASDQQAGSLSPARQENSSCRSLPEQFGTNNELRLRVRELQLQLESVRTSCELLRLRGAEGAGSGRQGLGRELLRAQQIVEQGRGRERELCARLQRVQAEHARCGATVRRQQEMVEMLEGMQRAGAEERAEMRGQVRRLEEELQEKRGRVRELEGERVTLMMGALTTEKEIGFMRERVAQSIARVYSVAAKLMRERCASRKGESSGSGWRREGESDTSYKLASAHRLSNQELPWLDESEAFRQRPDSQLSSSGPMDDFSISHIKSKNREQVSLLNSELFVKGSQTAIKPTSAMALRGISDSVRAYCVRIEQALSAYCSWTGRQLSSLRRGCHVLDENKCQLERNQQSLLGHLERLEGGLECQLEVAEEREGALGAALERVAKLEEQLGQKHDLLAQLQGAVYGLQQQREQLRRDLREADYAHAQWEEEMMAAFNGGEVSAGRMHVLSPMIRPARGTRGERQRALSGQSSTADYERVVDDYREQVRTLEMQLNYERGQAEELRANLAWVEEERRKLQFAVRLRERMGVLNQSIEVSREGEEEKGTMQSLDMVEEDLIRVLVDDQ